ncbi:adenine-specific methyltransferase EcoRI family protein, partial [Candidatus Saccharibacteria bacterium]|nr:adenine-specific methyltransferase EcoRI family protein [Candidatus Saccharibacteria bacterium]
MARNNANLHRASKAKNDEFYTQLPDIENELRHYKEHFKDKVVFCNCDDPFESNFFKYFAMNFKFLGLKKLICTCYSGSPVSYTELNNLPLFHKDEKMPYKIEITEVPDMNGDGATDLTDIELLLRSDENNLTILDGDGDFRSAESIEFLKEADIVVTNPPFSLFREYVAQLMEYDKKFVIIGGMNAITYKEIFPLIKANRMWLGYGFKGGNAFFRTPQVHDYASGVYDEKTNLVKFRNCVWYTNLDIQKRHEELDLFQSYSPEKYPKYDNYDAINVDKVADIPKDYYEGMGVPITYLEKHNPDQFEIERFRKGDDGKDLEYTV